MILSYDKGALASMEGIPTTGRGYDIRRHAARAEVVHSRCIPVVLFRLPLVIVVVRSESGVFDLQIYVHS